MKQAEKAEAAAVAASSSVAAPSGTSKASGRMARMSLRPGAGAKSAGKAKTGKGAGAAAGAPAPRKRRELLAPITAVQRSEFIKAFGIFDKAKAGALSFGRVAKLASAQGYPLTRGQVASLATVAGAADSGMLSAEQFAEIIMAHAVRQPKPTLDDMIAALERLPAAAGTGALTGSRALKILSTAGEPLDKEELESLALEGGVKPDSAVTLRHLVTVMMTSE